MKESTSSRAVTRASHSHLPGSAKAIKTTATSGRKCLELLNKRDPLGSLLKTLLVTSRWGSTRCYLTWKTKATPQGRLLFQLLPSTPIIDEIESGLLPTPTAVSYGSNQGGAAGRTGKVRHSLASMARNNLWPTPRSAMTGAATSGRLNDKERNLEKAVAQTGDRGHLNPQWIEWLMGYPEGWTELNHSETP